MQITETYFEQTYRPIQNPIDTNASFNGWMFETFGEEIEYVGSQSENNVWTIVEDDEGDLIICDGIHFVNRLGYVVTEVPHNFEGFEVIED